MSDIDISREMVEHLCHIHRGYEQHGTVAMLLALRAALDAAEADKRQAVLDERERCAKIAATRGLSSKEAAAAIRNQGEPK